MNINQIRGVLAVAEYQSASEAAKKLFITQPALSLQVAKLERELGYILFERKPGGMFLTEQGKIFCIGAERLMEAWNSLQYNIDQEQLSCAGSLRIGLGPRVFSNHLFDRIQAFFDAHPEIRVTYLTGWNKDPLEGLRRDELDIALDRFPPPNMVPDFDRFAVSDLISERYCALLSPDDPASRRSAFLFRQFAGRTVIAGTPDSMPSRIMLRDCGIAGITVYRGCCCDDTALNMKMIREGRGVSAGPTSFGDYYGVAAVPIQPEIRVSLQFISLSKSRENPRIRLFHNDLTTYCYNAFPITPDG